ncbi:ribosome biogenesis GTP-binding protein YihA/YsxC [Microaerobacter geothermalis]|uniref:ribosome biogenesis GTP-binding protein YihA/YsxC n=1 Tax=Microaerobacter geothermalis TaxID=674972 RepID=UPI001F000B0C|nr:ribosome biogenesis GTP-binding protein YihA/YsxC [Microaerobacter geothermalis]MCF6092640.1 ribosome biogenesis GTP-binding protein YihA/YsxC [Microaerobacter geothermalis]
MKITDAHFVISAVSPNQYPNDALPEIALVGRSNVGKSSLINCLIRRKSLARTSSKPGKTQTLNYYRINQSFYFVDLPGYGFAKVSKKVKEEWGRMIESYLRNRKELRLVIQLIDVRHPPTKDDQDMYRWLTHYQIPTLVVATKADKIPRGKWQKHMKIVKETLEMNKQDPGVLFSAETAQGRDEIWSYLMDYINRH